LQAAIYQRPENLFRDHAKARVRAMLLRDAAAEQGGVSEQQWNQNASLLDDSRISLEKAVLNPIESRADRSHAVVIGGKHGRTAGRARTRAARVLWGNLRPRPPQASVPCVASANAA
jgi:hypothetical protein